MMRRIRYFLCAALCVGLLLALSTAALARSEGLEVHFMDIGRNDGILIRCGGEDVFIDAGGYKRGEEATAYMKSVGVTGLKYYIGTHAHDDHVGGAPVIIAAMKPGAVIQPHDGVRKAIIKNIRATNQKVIVRETPYVTMTVGQEITVGGATLKCIGPVSIRKVSAESGFENDNSLVLMLTYGEVDILLSADATSSSFEAIAAADPSALQADVYKNAHHNQVTREPIIRMIQPEYVIFSTAKGRGPSDDYQDILSRNGILSLMTTKDHSGHIILRTDGQSIAFETQHAAESLTLRAETLEVYEGDEERIRPTLRPSGRARLLVYESADPSIASVNGWGRVSGLRVGETVITVKDAGGVEAQCRVVVKPVEMKMRRDELTVKQGSRVNASVKITPSGSKPVITWSSSDESVAVVDQEGRITGVYPGTAIITASTASGQTCDAAVTVRPISVSRVSIKPSSLTLTIGDSRTVEARISPENATWPDVTWTSADESIATVSQDGAVRAVGVGKTTITATTREGKSRTAKITVRPVYVQRIRLSAVYPENGLVGGVTGRNQVQLSCAIQPANATIPAVTWSSSNGKVATVDENGLVTGHKAGKVSITCKATDGSGEYERIRLTFAENELKRERITPAEGELIARASRIRYRSEEIEVRMTWVNRTGEKQAVPLRGTLMLITPDGEQIPLAQTGGRQTVIRHRGTKTETFRIPLSAHPQLRNLDLTRCDAIIVPHPGQ